MIHLTESTKEMLEDWTKNGFNGIRFVQCLLEVEHQEDEETKEEFHLRSRDYTIFVAQPDYPERMGPDSDQFLITINFKEIWNQQSKRSWAIISKSTITQTVTNLR